MGQEQEGGLEGVLRVLDVPEHAPADGEHHRPVPPQQQGECFLLMPLRKPLQKLTVGLFLGSPDSGKLADVPNDQAQLRVRHESDSPGGPVTGIVPPGGRLIHIFVGFSERTNGQTSGRLVLLVVGK